MTSSALSLRAVALAAPAAAKDMLPTITYRIDYSFALHITFGS
jgi:hypothetical protein